MLDTHPTPPTHKSPPAVKIAQGLVNVALIILAVRDIRRRRDEELKGNRKMWLAVACMPPIGPIAYYLFGRQRNTSTAEIPLEIAETP